MNNYTKIQKYSDHIRYLNDQNQWHRTDGPAFEWIDGVKEWFLNGRRHRTDGPAIEWDNGSKAWYIDGLRHRTDGPAIEHPDGSKFWYINDKYYSEKQFNYHVKTYFLFL